MKNYYVISNGRIRRDQNTIFIDQESTGLKKPIPVEDVDSLYVFGEVDLNTKLLNFLTQKRIVLHVFNYYGYYSGTYYPREYLHSGYMLVQQVAHYSDGARRLAIAKETVRAAAHSMLKNVGYYVRRTPGSALDVEPAGEIGAKDVNSGVPTDVDVETAVDSAIEIESLTDSRGQDIDTGPAATDDGGLNAIQATITRLASSIDSQTSINDLMGVEGKMRERYYEAWGSILRGDWEFERRVRRPPDNEVNALISFGNSILYTVCTSEIYRTQLTPTISYLHEPGERRFSLALDISELFKPLIVDRAIFRLLNTRQLTEAHFDRSLDGCVLNEAGKRLYLAALEERLASTIRHRRLGRHVSYRHLIRLECYKLIRHLTGIEPYRAFRAWW
ncbi:MAG: CRISPR-associated endonuclease Cas1 [Capsulimonadaceae bacterium]|nr:CRISPR-associated endonuclease Cas1 [Capsulimonadaceae bacterium]